MQRVYSAGVSLLRAAWLIQAQRLQESAESLSSNELRGKLSDAVTKAHEGTTSYGQYQDHTGDEDSGDVIYQCSGQGESSTMKAPYKKGTATSDSDYTVDKSKAVKVVPRMTYEEQPDEGDQYAAMESAGLYTAGLIPLCERFVGKAERAAAPKSKFAGKGTSFPILKPEDVSAAAASIGRAGPSNYSVAVLKANIIRLAKEGGPAYVAELPKAWQDGTSDAQESARAARGGLRLVESVPFAIDIELREAFNPGKHIKLIGPMVGQTAVYTEAALKQAARDNIFHAGLPMRIDHPTAAEAKARPEGSVKDWGAVLAHDAEYLESYISGGKDQGPGLYSDLKHFSDHAQTINEKGPFAGVSICAYGDALMENGRPVMKQGKPVLERFTAAEGCDMVTRAGAGGMFLQESARRATTEEESDMTVEEKALLSRLVEKDVRREAIELGARTLEGVSLNESAKMYIIEIAVDKGIPKKEGALDAVKFTEAINAEARRFGGAIGAGPRVTGMGVAPAVVEITEGQRASAAATQQAEKVQFLEAYATLLGEQPDANGNLKLAEAAFRGRAS